MDNIEDYNLVFLLNDRYNLVEVICNIVNVSEHQDYMSSNMNSISTMTIEYMNQNKVKFDMNDILLMTRINVNQQEYVLVDVADIEYLFAVD